MISNVFRTLSRRHLANSEQLMGYRPSGSPHVPPREYRRTTNGSVCEFHRCLININHDTAVVANFEVTVVVVVSHIQRVGCQPDKLLYTVANPARGLLNRGKIKNKKYKYGSASPPPPRPARSGKIK